MSVKKTPFDIKRPKR